MLARTERSLGERLDRTRDGSDANRGRAVWGSKEAVRLLEEEMGGQPFVVLMPECEQSVSAVNGEADARSHRAPPGPFSSKCYRFTVVPTRISDWELSTNWVSS